MVDLPVVDPPKPEDALAVVKALTEVSAVFLVLRFVGGWSYFLNPAHSDV